MMAEFWREPAELLMDGSAGNLPGTDRHLAVWAWGGAMGVASCGGDRSLLNGSQGFSRRSGGNIGWSAGNTDTADTPGQTRRSHGNGCRAGCVNMACAQEEVDPTHPDQQMVVGVPSPPPPCFPCLFTFYHFRLISDRHVCRFSVSGTSASH